MSKLKLISGEDCIKILCKHFGFKVIRQKGSHIILKKLTKTGDLITVVPLHKELKLPTLKGALKLAKVEIERFVKYQ